MDPAIVEMLAILALLFLVVILVVACSFLCSICVSSIWEAVRRRVTSLPDGSTGDGRVAGTGPSAATADKSVEYSGKAPEPARCACPQGPYFGAQLAGIPPRCERCGQPAKASPMLVEPVIWTPGNDTTVPTKRLAGSPEVKCTCGDVYAGFPDAEPTPNQLDFTCPIHGNRPPNTREVLRPGWLARQMEQVDRDVKGWPRWMKTLLKARATVSTWPQWKRAPVLFREEPKAPNMYDPNHCEVHDTTMESCRLDKREGCRAKPSGQVLDRGSQHDWQIIGSDRMCTKCGCFDGPVEFKNLPSVASQPCPVIAAERNLIHTGLKVKCRSCGGSQIWRYVEEQDTIEVFHDCQDSKAVRERTTDLQQQLKKAREELEFFNTFMERESPFPELPTLLSKYEEAVAEVENLKAALNWHPISEAPHTGEHILVTDMTRYGFGTCGGIRQRAYAVVHWFDDAFYLSRGDPDEPQNWPTHFRSLRSEQEGGNG